MIHDIFYWTGVLWWFVIAIAGIGFVLIGAIEVLTQRLAPRSRVELRVVRGGVPASTPPPSPFSHHSHQEGA